MAFDIVAGGVRETIYRVIKLQAGDGVGNGPCRLVAPVPGCAVYSSLTTERQGRFVPADDWDRMVAKRRWSGCDLPPPSNSRISQLGWRALSTAFPRLRYVLTVRVTPCKEDALLVEDLLYWLSRHFGGCTILPMTGVWINDAARSKAAYNGNTEQTGGVEVSVSVSPAQRDLAQRLIRSICAFHVRTYDLPVRWVYIESSLAFANHTLIGSAADS